LLKRKKEYGYIYLIHCITSNKNYIGATRRVVTERWHDYINAYHRGYFSLQQPNNEEGSLLFDMLKYGISDFTFQVLDIVPLKDLFKIETEYILQYNSVEMGYNNIASESENGEPEHVIKVGKETRFKKGSIPQNAIPILAISEDNIIEFNSYNEATNYLLDSKRNIENFNFNQVNFRIRQATKKNLIFYGFKWSKEGITDFNYKEKEVKINKFLVGEIYSNSKGYKFEIIENLKNGKRKVKFINTGFETVAETKEISNGHIKDWDAPYVCDVGIVGKEINKPQSHYLYDKWRDMLRRCYDEKITESKEVKYSVCKEWLKFINYINDIESLSESNSIKNKKGCKIKLKPNQTLFCLKNVEIISTHNNINN
jgi:hypothetical protein